MERKVPSRATRAMKLDGWAMSEWVGQSALWLHTTTPLGWVRGRMKVVRNVGQRAKVIRPSVQNEKLVKIGQAGIGIEMVETRYGNFTQKSNYDKC
jgi:hypothetical protein